MVCYCSERSRVKLALKHVTLSRRHVEVRSPGSFACDNSSKLPVRFHRWMTRPFSRDRISHFHIFERHADQVLDIMAQRLREGHAVDIQDAFLRFTIDSASEFLFSSCVHSIDDGLPYPYHVRSACSSTSGVSSKVTDFPRAMSEVEDCLMQ